MSSFTLFTDSPLLALVPAALFLFIAQRTRRGPVWAAGWAWAVYMLYEWLMQHGFLCTGECNIRIDLLIIYPALAVLSLVGFLSALRGRKELEAP